ncbi:hypothetical protein [Streptomyces sp. NPDC013455]|uniref:hypothetical protein n=1 Tax=Streptomyces sp. NPDC013455 TaxID=3155605 RepID=UPI0033F6591D
MDELRSDTEFADRLAVLLHASTRQNTGSVVITGSRLKHNQIALGPLTINNTPGVRVFLACAALLLLALVVLGVYGGVQVITAGNEPKAQPQATGSQGGGQPTPRDGKGSGGTDRPRIMTAAEANEALPTLEAMPSGWTLFDYDMLSEDDRTSDCHADGIEFENDPPKDLPGGGSYLVAWFRVYACSSPAQAAEMFEKAGQATADNESVLAGSSPGSTTPIPLPPLGNQRTAYAYGGEGRARSVVRVGTVVVSLSYWPFGSLAAHQDQITQLTRMAVERVEHTLAGT